MGNKLSGAYEGLRSMIRMMREDEGYTAAQICDFLRDRIHDTYRGQDAKAARHYLGLLEKGMTV